MQSVEHNNQDLYAIAKCLIFFPYLIIVSIFAHFFPPALILSSPLFSLFALMLARAAKLSRPWTWAILALLPFAGLVCTITLVCKSVRILKENGVKVGIFGVRKKEMDSLLAKQNE